MNILPNTSDRDWRTAALDSMLHGFNNAENLDGLLAVLFTARPNLHTVVVDPDRQQLMRFLRERATNLNALIPATEIYERRGGGFHSDDEDDDSPSDTERATPYIGWYTFHWRDAEIEIVLTPSWGTGNAVCMGDNRERLHTFVRELHEYCIRPLGRCLRYRSGWESAVDLDGEIGKVTWSDIVLAPEMLGRIRDAVEGFFTHRDAFKEMGFAWRRGILLIGPPGTGKTMVCKAAAAAMPGNMPFLYVRDLRERAEREAIRSIFERARKLAPCLLAFEDLDGLVDKSNRTVFLNEMDGFASNDGLLIIASSNHPERIDEALLTRPSRFDRVFHLGLPEKDVRRLFCTRILTTTALADKVSPDLNIEKLADRVAETSEGFTPAYLKETFVSAALQRVQAGATVLDQSFADAVLSQVVELKEHLKKMRDPQALAEMKYGDNAVGFRAK